MSGKPLYLDYHATTPVDPRVLAEMLPFFTERFGNPASRQHAWGWEARDVVEDARAKVARLINASASEIVFTSGASESNNLAICGVAQRPGARNHVATAATEHKSVLAAVEALRSRGFDVTILPVGPDGRLDMQALRAAVTERTLLVSVMAANNEIGTLQPLADIGAVTRARGALFHTDAAQAAGKIPIDVESMQIDLLSLTGHKCYGPKGCGALYIRRMKPRLALTPLVFGGGQEQGIRSGTLNVPGIVGLGAAAELCRSVMPDEALRLSALRDRLLAGLQGLHGVTVNGSMVHRLPHNLHISVEGVEGEALLMALGDLAVSTGSACASGSTVASHVLQAIGATGQKAAASIRFGLGRTTTADEVDLAVQRVTAVVNSLRRQGVAAPLLSHREC
jgi:cysteine desulfurase